MENLSELMREYASLVIKKGLNIRPGRKLVINCSIDSAEFARCCADAAYDEGCSEVIMKWSDDYLTRAKYLYADPAVFDEEKKWEKEFYDYCLEQNVAWLAIHADDPDNLKGVEPDRIRRNQMARSHIMADFRKAEMKDEFPWCVVSVPTPGWVRAVFPDLEPEEGTARLWKEILAACRVEMGQSVENWEKHTRELQHHVEILNRYNFKSLKYTNSLGTDFEVELPEGHYWAGGTEKTLAGLEFSANIPTEEVFTLPKRDASNGVIYASKPLSLDGNVIRDFCFVVKDGRITEVHAKEGEEVLRNAIGIDEGASYFGEVALVPYDSPISRSGVLFYNTLFDENASCHFAFGAAYPCIRGSEKMSEEQLRKLGMNSSSTHVDFMVGTSDLSIIGTTQDGEKITVFENGNFAF